MSNLADQTRPAVHLLLEKDENQLYTEMGSRLWAIQANPSISGSFEPRTLETLGPGEDFWESGKRFFERVNVQAYQLICGENAIDIRERQEFADAFSIDRETVASVLAALLIGYLGIAPAIAPAVAALLVRLFFNPAYETMCHTWNERLNEEAN